MIGFAGMPHLDIYTLSETWAISEAIHAIWMEIGRSLGAPPSRWKDDEGRRIYAAVMALTIECDLSSPVEEDGRISHITRLAAIRKPHSIGETTFSVNDRPVMKVRLLTSLVRRDIAGSNKKLSKVRDIWKAPDQEPESLNDWLARHHASKQQQLTGSPLVIHEANRLADFNNADLFYFRNFVSLARAAEWKAGRSQSARLAGRRDAFFYANVDDGDLIEARCGSVEQQIRSEIIRTDGTLLFVSNASMTRVEIPQR